jgi:hypothetical protein
MDRSAFHWWAGSEPAWGVSSRFWWTCNSAGRADGQFWPVWSKEMVTTPALTVMLPNVISTWAGQLAAGELLELPAIAVPADDAPAPAASARWAPAASRNADARMAADRYSAEGRGTRFVVVIWISRY